MFLTEVDPYILTQNMLSLTLNGIHVQIPTSPFNVYIPITINCIDYQPETFHAFIDTESAVTLAKPHVFPNEYLGKKY